MKPDPALERCFSFVNLQIQPPKQPPAPTRRPSVTISRQVGSGGHALGEALAAYLQAHNSPGSCPWTVFDRNLVEKVLEDHNLPKRLARFMPEDRVSEISDSMDELFGLHPPSWTLVHQTAETILHLVELGHVIIIGRGAHVVTARIESVFHVRLVGSVEKRLERLQELQQLSRKNARALLHKEDRGRARYLKKHYDKDIEDPLLYHLTLNTDLIGTQEAARIIGDAVLHMSPVPARTEA